VLRRKIAEISDNAKISKYSSKYSGQIYEEIGGTGVTYVRYQLLFLFKSVAVCTGTTYSEYEKIFKEFLSLRKFRKQLMYSLIKPSLIS